MAIALLVGIPFVVSQSTGVPFLSVSYSFSPQEIEPGDKVNLVVTITNKGTEYARDVKFDLLSNLYVKFEKSTFKFQVIGPGDSVQFSVPFKVLTSVDTSVFTIFYEIDYKSGTSESTQTIAGGIPVQLKKQATLEITSIESKGDLRPGGNVELKLTLTNKGSGTAKHTIVSLDLTNVPFAPLSTGSELVVGDLQPSESKVVTFNLSIDESADVSVYQVPVTITYEDELNNEKTKTSYVGIKVSGDAEFFIGIEETSNMITGGIGEVSLTIANVGETPAKYLTVYVNSSRLRPIYTSYYIGTLDPDDYETIDLRFDLSAVTPGVYPVKIFLEYKDPYNNQKIVEKTVNLKVGLQNVTRTNGKWSWIIVAMVLVVIYFKKKSIKKLFRKG